MKARHPEPMNLRVKTSNFLEAIHFPFDVQATCKIPRSRFAYVLK